MLVEVELGVEAEVELNDAAVVELDDAAVVGVELRSTEVNVAEILLEVVVLGLSGVVVVVVVRPVVVACCAVVFDGADGEPSGQKVISRLALFVWHAIWTQVSSGCLNAVLQPGASHVVPTPSQPS